MKRSKCKENRPCLHIWPVTVANSVTQQSLIQICQKLLSKIVHGDLLQPLQSLLGLKGYLKTHSSNYQRHECRLSWPGIKTAGFFSVLLALFSIKITKEDFPHDGSCYFCPRYSNAVGGAGYQPTKFKKKKSLNVE